MKLDRRTLRPTERVGRRRAAALLLVLLSVGGCPPGLPMSDLTPASGEDAAWVDAAWVDAAWVDAGWREDATGGGGCPGDLGPGPDLAGVPQAAHLWSRGLRVYKIDSVAVDAGGNVIAAGQFDGTIDLGGGPLRSAGGDEIFGTDVFLVKYSSSGAHLWSRRMGGAAQEGVYGVSVAVDGAGDVVLASAFRGIADFGGAPLKSGIGANPDDIALAKYASATGAHLWSRSFGGRGMDIPTRVTANVCGDVFLAGNYAEVIDLGGGPLIGDEPIGLGNAFAAKFTPAGGHVWSQSYPGRGYVSGLAGDPTGDLVLTGNFEGMVDFGGGLLTGAVLVRYGAAGGHRWSRRIPRAGGVVSGAVTLARDGSIVSAGTFSGTMDLGGGALTSAGTRDLYLARHDPAGTHRWSFRLGGPQSEQVGGVATDEAGNIAIAGYFSGDAEFGGPVFKGTGLSDIYLAKFTSAGAPLWSRQYGTKGRDTARGLAMDRGGGLLILAELMDQPLDFGGGPLSGFALVRLGP